MIKKLFLTLALGAALLPVASADSQDFIEKGLKEKDIKYSVVDGKFTTHWRGGVVVVSWVDTESSVLYICGYSSSRLPEAKWPLAYERLNTERERSHLGFYLDSDGDVRVEHLVDIDDMEVSSKAYLASLSYVVKWLARAHDEMMKVRYQFAE